MRDIIVGPSHVVRLEHLYKNKVIKKPSRDVVFIGRGGAPTWSKQLFELFVKTSGRDDKLHLIIGDFRFGNSIIEDVLDIDNSKINHINVTGRLISVENDLLMANLFIRGLSKWKEMRGDINFIPWTIIMRRADNIIKHSHVDEKGNYKHPQIDEVVILDKFCDPSFIRCLEIPVDKMCQFYIDGDLHPSTLGYMFILDMVKKHDPYKSINSSIMKLSLILNDFLNKIKIKKTILITGDSVALSTLSKVIPFNKSGFDKFKSCSYSDYESNFKDLKHDMIVIELLSLESSKINSADRGHASIKFPWDYLGFATISKRHVDLHRLKPTDMSLEGYKDIDCFEELDQESIFDIGERLTPTIKGMLFIISLASNLDYKKKNKILEETLTDIFCSESKAEPRNTILKVLFKKIFKNMR